MSRIARAFALSAIAMTVMNFTAAAQSTHATQAVQEPEEFFGFRLGADGELARYPKVLEYLQHVAGESDRVLYEELGKTTEGNPYVLLKISSPENLARLDRLVEINRRLADPRGLDESDARAACAVVSLADQLEPHGRRGQL